MKEEHKRHRANQKFYRRELLRALWWIFGALLAALVWVVWQYFFPPTKVWVTMTDKGFTPATVHVRKGGLVIWHNNGSEYHMPASGEHHAGVHTGWSAHDQVGHGQNYYNFFRESGTYEYHDILHPELKGEVIVR